VVDHQTTPISPKEHGIVPQNPASTLEQYKAYLQDLGNLGTRSTTSNSFFLSILSALLGLLTLMKPSEGVSDLRTPLRVAVPLFALGLCCMWRQTIQFYDTMFKVKFDVLRELERHGSLYPIFEREKNLLWPRPWLRKYEHWIPVFLALPFGLIFFSALWSLVHGA